MMGTGDSPAADLAGTDRRIALCIVQTKQESPSHLQAWGTGMKAMGVQVRAKRGHLRWGAATPCLQHAVPEKRRSELRPKADFAFHRS